MNKNDRLQRQKRRVKPVICVNSGCTVFVHKSVEKNMKNIII